MSVARGPGISLLDGTYYHPLDLELYGQIRQGLSHDGLSRPNRSEINTAAAALERMFLRLGQAQHRDLANGAGR